MAVPTTSCHRNTDILLHDITPDPDASLAVHGYKKLNKICDTLQGELYKAQKLSNHQYVAIKIVDRTLHANHISIEDGTSFCVAENIVKEALILKYLSVDNTSIGRHIVEYLDFFADGTHYYLVLEYIASQIHLKQFIDVAFVYMANKKLQWKHYQSVIKYLFWQLMVTIHWMHQDMKSCHLDLCLENIMLRNCSFIQQKGGHLTVNPSISIALCDFGVAETFRMGSDASCSRNPFIVYKIGLSLENESYLAPKICSEEAYDARAADIWSVGMILFHCLAGKPMWTQPMDVWTSQGSQHTPDFTNGYWALYNGQLHKYLHLRNFNKFNSDAVNLLIGLLHLNENKRLNSMQVLQQQWFKRYFKTYSKQIEAKSKSH